MKPERLVLTNANLLDGDSAARPGSTVVVSGNRIEDISAGAPVKPMPGDRVVDVRGRTVMPGMVTAHFHASYDSTMHHLNRPLGLDAPPAYQAIRATVALKLALECGFTGAVGAGTAWNIDASLKMALDAGIIEGPRLVPCGRDLVRTGQNNDLHIPWFWGLQNDAAVVPVDGVDTCLKVVREEVKRGAAMIKLYVTNGHSRRSARQPMEFTKAELATLIGTAHDCGVRIRGHVCSPDATLECLKQGMDIIDHADGMDDRCVDAFLKTGATLVPSLLYMHLRIQTATNPVLKKGYLGDQEGMLAILPRANKAGVKMVLGDDHGGFPLEHGRYAEELEYYVKEAGIPPLDVIRWATKNGGELLGLGDEVGTLRPGKLADLLVVDGDPVADIGILKDRSRLLAIMKDGRLFKDELSRLEAAETSSARRPRPVKSEKVLARQRH